MPGRQGRTELQVPRDRRVGELVEEIGLPVPLEARRVEGVEQALQGRVRDGAGPVERGGAEAGADRREGRLCFLRRPGVAPDDAAHRPVPERLREGRGRRHAEEGEEAAERVGRGGQEVTIPTENLLGVVQLPEHRAGIEGADRVQAEEEGGDDAEVAPAAAHRPEEVGMLVRAGDDEAAVRQNHVDGEEVVDGEAVGAGEVAEAPAEGDPADAGGRDDAAGGRQAEGVRGVVEIPEGAAALDAGGARRGVDADAFHRRQVQDQAVVAGAQAGAAVPAAPDGEEEAPLAGEIDGGDHVRDVRGADDEGGAAVDHPVIDLAGRVVTRVAGAGQFAAQGGAKALNGRIVEGSSHFPGNHHALLLPGPLRQSAAATARDPRASPIVPRVVPAAVLVTSIRGPAARIIERNCYFAARIIGARHSKE